MSRTKSKSIDQIETSDTIFSDKATKQDKRTETKEFVVERDPSGLYAIKYTAGGEVPNVLKGRFTSLVRAQEAIDNVLATRAQQQAQT